MINIRRKKIINLVVAVNIFFLAIIIFFSPFVFNVFNLNTYKELYEENKVFERLNKNDVVKITENLFDFFKHRDQIKVLDFEEDFNFFEPEEVMHLEDVRVLFDSIFILYAFSAVVFIVLTVIFVGKGISKFMKLLSYFLLGGSLTVITVMILLYLFSQNFMHLFENFHLLFFPQGNYTFAHTSLIISLFPFGFFNDFFIKLVFESLIIAVILLIASIVILTISKYIIKKGRS